jgi:signal transduction histidine kinase
MKLKMALMNLITNAVEAMEEMEGKLSLSLEKAGNRAILTITDNGCGISEENISRLFEPYFSQKRNGVGLGLTFTLNILQSHGATIDVASTLGLGSAFTIFFPLAN